MAEMRRRRPEVEFSGMGGSEMKRQRFDLLADARDASVMGFSAVLRRLPALRRAHAALRARLLSGRVRVALLIDFPDFNLRLAVQARRAGVQVVYLVAPQTWAWRPGRLRALPRQVDRMLCVLPFEEEELRAAGVSAVFVGHPMRDLAKASRPDAEIRRLYALPEHAVLVALVPGSRTQIVRRLLPVMVEAARRVAERHPEVEFLVPQAPMLDGGQVARATKSLGARVHVRTGSFTDLVSTCTAAVSSSGTATLELALLGVPSVIVYRVGSMMAWIARRYVHVSHVGLPNLIAGRKILPERLQEELHPEAVAADLEAWLSDPAERERISRQLRGLRERLGPPGVMGRVAEELLRVPA